MKKKFGIDLTIQNKLIILASNIIAATFQYLHTYRIGGDEFIVIIENKSDDEINKL